MNQVVVSMGVNNKEQQSELSRKLYRSTSEHAKQLDDAKGRARSIDDLFSVAVLLQRKRFREYCVRLIFTDPVLYSKKVDELMWRKAFYEPICHAKKLKGSRDYTNDEMACLQMHLSTGIGFYHHFIAKISSEIDFSVEHRMDFGIYTAESFDSGPTWAQLSIHQSLIYLGDLNRYRIDIWPEADGQMLAYRYYYQAMAYKPEQGMAHNQLATLALNRSDHMNAAFHYIRCLCCSVPFEGATNNLLNLVNSQPSLELTKTMLHLIEAWYFDKIDTDKVCVLCQDAYKQLETIAQMHLNVANVDQDDSFTNELKCYNELLYQIATICLLCIAKLQREKSTLLSTVIAFTMALYSKLLECSILRIKTSIINYNIVENRNPKSGRGKPVALIKWIMDRKENNKNRKTINLRRRKKIHSDDSDDSEAENDKFTSVEIDTDASSSENDDDETAVCSLLADSSDDEDVDESSDDDSSDTFKYSDPLEKIQLIDGNVMTDIIAKDASCLLPAVKLLNDWLMQDLDVIKSCDENIKMLYKQLCHLLNLLNVIVEPTMINCLTHELKRKTKKSSLPEDEALRGVDLMKNRHENLDWQRHRKYDSLYFHEQNVVRIARIIKFGIFLSGIEETRISLDESRLIFQCQVKQLNGKNGFIMPKMWKFQITQHNIVQDTTEKETSGGFTIGDKKCGDDLVDDRAGSEVSSITGSSDRSHNNSECVVDVKNNGNTLGSVANDVAVSVSSNGSQDISITQVNGNDSITVLSKSNEAVAVHLPTNDHANAPIASPHKGQLMKMKHMGQLWLASEVRALENKVRNKPALSPYLVLDADALIKFNYMVKHLVHSKKFIILIPTAVVSALDELKRDQSEARDVIRWLESQFHRGNRFFRAQRPHETSPIPYIKYPKKKDKEMCLYIAMVECCHYLAAQQKGAANVVTLLMGKSTLLSNTDSRDFSYTGLAESAGIAIDTIQQFYVKWKKNNPNVSALGNNFGVGNLSTKAPMRPPTSTLSSTPSPNSSQANGCDKSAKCDS